MRNELKRTLPTGDWEVLVAAIVGIYNNSTGLSQSHIHGEQHMIDDILAGATGMSPECAIEYVMSFMDADLEG